MVAINTMNILLLLAFSFSSQKISLDGRCGSKFGDTVCTEAVGGKCCSQYGYCGNTKDHCDFGCQSGCLKPTPTPIPVPVPAPGGKCGDGICDMDSETCFSCSQDCGACDMQYIDKCTKPGLVSLTFDDGPTEHTPRLLDILKRLGVKATFFYIGEKLDNKTLAGYAKRAFSEGHILASHTFSHPFLTKLTDRQIRDEMMHTDDSIEKITGEKPIFMRNPYSDMDDRVLAVLEPSMGYESIFTSLDTQDTEVFENNPQLIFDNVKHGLDKADKRKDSFVITQHETILPSIKSVKQIVTYAKAKGYKIVNLDVCRGLKRAYKDI